MSYDKPFKTIKEQIEILRSRNISINDEEFAYHVLTSSSYYSIINGYKQIFLKSHDPETYKDGTNLETIYTLHLIETKLTNTLFKYIIYCERSLKTKMAYLIAKKYSVDEKQYLDRKNYSNANNMANSILASLNDTISNAKDNTTTYYYKKNHNHIPPWVLVNDIPFGKTIKWYSILRGCDKTDIVNQIILFDNHIKDIELKKELFKKALDLLKDFRNKIAHGNKIFSSLLKTKLPKNPISLICFEDIITKNEFDKGSGQNDVFSVIISIILLINDNMVLNNFLQDIKNILDAYKKIKFVDKDIYEVLEIPKDYRKKLNLLIRKKSRMPIDNAIKRNKVYGNPKSKVYHCKGQSFYEKQINPIIFNSEEEAQKAGYRKSLR